MIAANAAANGFTRLLQKLRSCGGTRRIMEESVIKKILILPLAFFTVVFQAHSAENTASMQTDEVRIVFEETLRNAAEETATIYPKQKNEVEKILDWKLDFRPTIWLTNNRGRFEELTGTSLVVAYAIPQNNLIVIDYSRTSTRPFSLGTILKHELCHLLLHHHIRKAHLPRWLDEGVSQWASDGIAEILLNGKGSYLDAAVLSNRLIGLERLSVSFPKDEKSLLLAYEQSKSLVDYIGNKFGRTGILSLLQRLKDGDEVDEAIQKSLALTSDEMERRWRSHLRRKITWFTYLTSNLYGILFFFAALITVVGFIRLVIKKRRMEEEE
jgi:hypothetical protein